MNEKLRRWIGQEVQAATSLDLLEGVLVSVDEAQLTLRLSDVSGYERGRHAVVRLSAICYVRPAQETGDRS